MGLWDLPAQLVLLARPEQWDLPDLPVLPEQLGLPDLLELPELLEQLGLLELLEQLVLQGLLELLPPDLPSQIFLPTVASTL